MDSDDELLGCMMDAMEEEEEEGNEEDWTDTSWAQPLGVSTLFNSGARQNVQTVTEAGKKKEIEPSDPSVIKRMLLNDNKAGMEGLDKEKINQIIHEASKGSKFYENEKSKEEQMKRRIEEQKKKIGIITEAQLKEGLLEADRLLEDFDQQRDLSHTIIHIDMDAFYAAVEMRDRPELKHKPMAVGGTAMLSTSNYHARKFGVRAAMPGFIGKKLCPDLVIMPLNFDKYTAVSKEVRAIFTKYDPNFCPMSLDEAYLDITEHLEERKTMPDLERTYICRHRQFADSKDHCLCDLNDISKIHGANPVNPKDENSVDLHSYLMSGRTFDSLRVADTASEQECCSGGKKRPLCPVCYKELPPFYCVRFGLTDEDAVNELRTRIEQKTHLTASAGIAPNMMLAKVCSDRNKPNGQYKVPPTKTEVISFIKDLPTRKISGIGKVSEAMLNALGVYTCTDLYEKRALLYHLYSPISFNYFMRICLGIGSTTVERDSERKSMSTERTFSELSRPADLYRKCEELCESLAEDLKTEQLKGKTVGIKIKTVKFEVKTKAHSLREYTNDKDSMLRAAQDLLRTEIQACAPRPLRLRLMGVRMSNLLPESHCMSNKQRTILGAFKKMSEKQNSVFEGSSGSEFVPGSQLNGSTILRSEVISSSEPGRELKGFFEPGSELKGSSEPGSELKGSSEPGSELKGSSEPGSEFKGSSELRSEFMSSSESGSELKGSSEPGSELKGSSEPGSELKGSSEPGSELKGSSEPGSELKGSSEPGSELKGSSEPGSELTGSSEPGSELKGSSEPESELKGSFEPGSELKGSSEPGSELKGSSEPGSELKGSSEPESELKGSFEPGSELKGSSEPESELKGSFEPGSELKGSFEPESELKGSFEPGSELKGSSEPGSEMKDKFLPRSKSKESMVPHRDLKDTFMPRSNLMDTTPTVFAGNKRTSQKHTENNEDVNVAAEDLKAVKDCPKSTEEDDKEYKKSVESKKDVSVETATISEETGLLNIIENATHGLKDDEENESLENKIGTSDSLEPLENRGIEVQNAVNESHCTVSLVQVSARNIEKEKEILTDKTASNLQCDKEVATADLTRLNERKTRSGLVCTPVGKQGKKRRNSKKDQSVSYSCPVCTKDVLCSDLNEFNTHVDECLNKNAIVDTGTGDTDSVTVDADSATVDTDIDKINDGTKLEELKSENLIGIGLQSNCDTQCTYISDVDADNKSDICKYRIEVEDDGVAVEVERRTLKYADIEETTKCDIAVNAEFKMLDLTIQDETNIELVKPNCPKGHEKGLSNSHAVINTEFLVNELVVPKSLNDVRDTEKSSTTSGKSDYATDNKSNVTLTEPGFQETNVTKNLMPNFKENILCAQSSNDSSGSSVHFSEIEPVDSLDVDDCNINDIGDITVNVQGKEYDYNDPEHETENDNEDCESVGLLVCPICNTKQRCGSLVDFNDHVDACLSRGAIKQILTEQRKKETQPQKRHSMSPDTPSGSQPLKRRKTVLPQKPVPCRSIVSFFKDK